MSAPALRVVGARPSGATAHNAEAEAAILAAVVDEPSTALPRAIAKGLAPEQFYVEPNGRVWEALLRMSEVPDAMIHAVTVSQWLKDRGRPEPEGGWTAYLRRQTSMVAPLEACIDLVIELADVRAVQAECEALAAEAKAPLRDRAAWLLAAQERIAARISVRTRPAPDFVQIMGEISAEMCEGDEAPAGMQGYSTGHRGVDERIGGLVPAEVILLTGPEKSGKSSLGAIWCANVANLARSRTGGRVGGLILQWEDERQKTISRLVGARARVDLSRRRRGLWNNDDQAAFMAAAHKFGALPLRVEDECRPNVLTIAARVRSVRDDMAARGVQLGVVMLDSLQVLEEDGQNREQQIENVMKRLVALKRAKDLKDIAWLVINHTGENGEMVNAKAAPRRWCNTWLNLRVDGDDKEERDGQRPAHLDLRLARDVAWGGAGIPLWCFRRYNNLFEDGGIYGR